MCKDKIIRVYEWFLELPAVIVLAVLWVVGVGLVGLFALALYSCWILLRTAGA